MIISLNMDRLVILNIIGWHKTIAAKVHEIIDYEIFQVEMLVLPPTDFYYVYKKEKDSQST